MKEEENDIDKFGIILNFGHFDQSNLTKDFQHFLGTTPQNFIKNLRERSSLLPGTARKVSNQSIEEPKARN